MVPIKVTMTQIYSEVRRSPNSLSDDPSTCSRNNIGGDRGSNPRGDASVTIWGQRLTATGRQICQLTWQI
jgi:hypothetical protein